MDKEIKLSTIEEALADFKEGKLVKEYELTPTTQKNGTFIQFTPDTSPNLFGNYNYRSDYIETMLRNYSYLNQGLVLNYNGQKIVSKNGLFDLLNEKCTGEILYPIVHLKGEDIEVAFTHSDQYGEEYYSFVNGQHTTQGGTHQSAFKEHIARTIKEYFGKSFKELLIEERMRRAHLLLTKTDMPIGVVIRSVGYENESYFHREFRKRFDRSPLALRKSERQ